MIGESQSKRGSLKLKRINTCFHNIITYYGRCYIGRINNESNIKSKRILIFLGGPIVSALIASIGFLMCYYTRGSFIMNRIFNGIVWSSLIQFLMTILPMTYKSGSYKNTNSDGKNIIAIFKEKS